MEITSAMGQVTAVTIADIGGRTVLGKEGAALCKLVFELLSEGQKRILLNLDGVNCIDTSGLGLLVSTCTTVRNQGGELNLLNLTKSVQDLMQITGLYTVFDVLHDQAVAVKSFRQSNAATA